MQNESKNLQSISQNSLKDNNIWYSSRGALGYNFFLLMCLGMRSRGKTTDWLRFCISDFKKRGHKFIWMRRYTTEIKGKSKEMPGCAHDFGKNLKDICGYDVTVEGNDIFADGEQCGQFFALSTAAKAKGLFPDKNLYNIVFDEFLIDNPRYSYIGGYNEPFELMKSIDSLLRPTPLHDVGRIIMLSNCVKLGNPYFLYFNIPNIENGIYFDKNRRILVEFDYNEAFRTLRESTSFGKLTIGTTYNDYAMKNQFILDSDVFIADKPYTAYFRYRIVYNGQSIGCWFDPSSWMYYLSEDIDPTHNVCYAINNSDMGINTMLVNKLSGTHFKELIDYYRFGQVRFTSKKIQSLSSEMIATFL